MCSPAPQAGDRGFKSRTARFARHHAIVAEWFRRLPSKQLYAGSIPAGRSKFVGWPPQGTRRAGGNGNRAGLENHGPASRPVGVRILCPPLRRREQCRPCRTARPPSRPRRPGGRAGSEREPTSTIAPWVMAARRALTPVCPRSNRGGRANEPSEAWTIRRKPAGGATRKGAG
jgi:hypothetical protein